MPALHLTDIEAAINWWRERRPTPEGEPLCPELTALAEAVVGAAYTLCEIGLVGQYGLPRLEDGSPCPISVVALGKAGGHELTATRCRSSSRRTPARGRRAGDL